VLVTAAAPAAACPLNDSIAMVGFAPDGLPLSVQVVGKHRAESALYRVALAYEAGTASSRLTSQNFSEKAASALVLWRAKDE